jgi:hypothetical protein
MSQLPATPDAFVEEARRRGLSPAQAWLALQEARPLLGATGAGPLPAKTEAAAEGRWPAELVASRRAAMAKAFAQSDWTYLPGARQAVVSAMLGVEDVSTNDKKAFVAAEAACGQINFAALLSDEVGHEELVAFLTGGDLCARSAPDAASWQSVKESADAFAWRLPNEASGDSPSPQSEPIERRVELFAKRFGFGVVSLGGFHTEQEAALVVGKLEEGCEALARATGLAEEHVGQGGATLLIGCPFQSWGSAFATPWQNLLCFSPKAGWSVFAHEWLHLFDSNLALKMTETARPAVSLFVSEGDADGGGKADAVAVAARALREAIRSGEAPARKNAKKTAERYAEADGEITASGLPKSYAEAATNRAVEGVFDRFLAPRLPAEAADAERKAFHSLLGAFMKGEGEAEPLLDWQAQKLGKQSEHYAKIALAERDLALERRKAETKAEIGETSAFERFAQLADERMGFEYSATPAELWARSFEGALHAQTPPSLRPFFTMGSETSGGYYPRGFERAAIAQAWGDFFKAVKSCAGELGLKFDSEPDFSAPEGGLAMGGFAQRRADRLAASRVASANAATPPRAAL